MPLASPSRVRHRMAPVVGTAFVGVVSLFVAAELVIRRGYTSVAVVTPRLVLETVAVLLLTWTGYRMLRSYVPTPRPEWSWVHPARELGPYAVISATSLALAAFVETLYIVRMLGT